MAFAAVTDLLPALRASHKLLAEGQDDIARKIFAKLSEGESGSVRKVSVTLRSVRQAVNFIVFLTQNVTLLPYIVLPTEDPIRPDVLLPLAKAYFIIRTAVRSGELPPGTTLLIPVVSHAKDGSVHVSVLFLKVENRLKFGYFDPNPLSHAAVMPLPKILIKKLHGKGKAQVMLFGGTNGPEGKCFQLSFLFMLKVMDGKINPWKGKCKRVRI